MYSNLTISLFGQPGTPRNTLLALRLPGASEDGRPFRVLIFCFIFPGFTGWKNLQEKWAVNWNEKQLPYKSGHVKNQVDCNPRVHRRIPVSCKPLIFYFYQPKSNQIQPQKAISILEISPKDIPTADIFLYAWWQLLKCKLPSSPQVWTLP